ncbi:MAG: agmatine/peptidylarginine deiminase, partial [Nitrospinaceae bacterium]
ETLGARLRRDGALAPGEEVCLLVNDPAMRGHALGRMRGADIPLEKVHIYIIPTNDAWIRDFGPNFLLRQTANGNGRVAANVWRFDSWGGKYDHDQDAQAAGRIMDALNVPRFEPGIVLEGGSIEVNGRGVCITTEQCLLHPSRNGGPSRREMETHLKAHLGISQVIWCQGQLEGDDTDGHVDNLIRFVNPNTVLTFLEHDPDDPNYPFLRKNLEILQSCRDPEGNPFDVRPLPSPGTVCMGTTRLPASYANFYIGNRVVLLPVFGTDQDRLAATLLARFLPGREVIPLDGGVLVSGLGGPHCLTQQQPL